jgi:hypothetical protein
MKSSGEIAGSAIGANSSTNDGRRVQTLKQFLMIQAAREK